VSTMKILGCLAAVCMSSPVACGQYDTPPTLPNFSAPPDSASQSVFPELPVPAAPVPAVRRPASIGTRPPRLSAESTAGLPKQVQNVIDFYGGATSARALAQLPQRPSSGATRPALPRQMPKPFEGTVPGAPPTISPYLNLFIDESPEGLPNYHTYVRPLQQQQQANDAARQRIGSLQRQVQQVSYGQPIQQSRSGSVPGTGHGTRYFNTTQYYRDIPRLR
jgi:hypothetical protein